MQHVPYALIESFTNDYSLNHTSTKKGRLESAEFISYPCDMNTFYEAHNSLEGGSSALYKAALG